MTARRSLSTKQRAAIFLAGDGCCHLCGGKITPGQAWEVEHIIPLAMGGDDEGDNLRPAHAKCHRAKTSEDLTAVAKAKRREAKHRGWKAASKRPMPGSRASGWKQKMSGEWVRR